MREGGKIMRESMEELKINEMNIRPAAGMVNFFARQKNQKRKAVVVKERILKVVLGLSLALSLVGCASNSKQTTITEEPIGPTTTQTADPNAAEPSEEEMVLPADLLQGRVTHLSWTNNMKTRAEMEAELNAGSDSYKGPTYTPEKGGDTWVSKEDYQEAVDAGLENAPAGTTVTTVESGYLAPDGTVWESEAEYKKYVEGQKETGTTEVESGYVAPDGTIWTSEAEYQKYVQSNNGTTVLPGSGEVVEQGEGYRAPDGTYWTSEAEYWEFINGNSYHEDNQDFYEDTGSNSYDVDEYGGYYADGVYWVGGEAYASKQDYIDLVYGQSYNQPSGDYQETPDTGMTDGDYYQDPDGNIWASYQDYLDYINSLGDGYHR